MLETISQFAILFTGVVAVFLSQSSKENNRKFASIFGLLGQPFWMYTTYHSQQWGIFLMTFLYTFSWGKGFWLFWIKPKLLEREKINRVP